ncbi:MAG: hypothetical protein GTN93_13780 [Anaerolineae bacterium]|nr:hypothetical protein [Anaerolineae bacterium]
MEPRNRVEQWLWTAYRAVPALSPNEFHLNCVRVYRDEVYVTLLNWPWRSRACLLRIEPDVHIEFGSKDIGMPHNAQILDEGHLIVNDTEKQALKVFARSTGELVNHISCAEMGIEGKAWLRGLKPLGNRRVLVGAGAWSSVVGEPDWRRTIPPAQIMEVDLEAREVSRRVVVSDKGLTSIHGLDAFP